MKKKISMLAVGFLSLTLVGCGGHSMMMEEMQMRMNAVEITAANAENMASESMMMSKKMMHKMHKMHGHKMMK